MANRKFRYRPLCEGCVWNNKPRCGQDFCMLPRCVRRRGDTALFPGRAPAREQRCTAG